MVGTTWEKKTREGDVHYSVVSIIDSAVMNTSKQCFQVT